MQQLASVPFSLGLPVLDLPLSKRQLRSTQHNIVVLLLACAQLRAAAAGAGSAGAACQLGAAPAAWAAAARKELRDSMWRNCGIVRHRQGLKVCSWCRKGRGCGCYAFRLQAAACSSVCTAIWEKLAAMCGRHAGCPRTCGGGGRAGQGGTGQAWRVHTAGGAAEPGHCGGDHGGMCTAAPREQGRPFLRGLPTPWLSKGSCDAFGVLVRVQPVVSRCSTGVLAAQHFKAFLQHGCDGSSNAVRQCCLNTLKEGGLRGSCLTLQLQKRARVGVSSTI
eukprot:1158087-Pelagomonas_calceolata.AAC.3